MLLRITVLQYKGAPPEAAIAYMFDERGGNIGREDCNLTLPDPTRVLSRVQAQISFADGLFNLIDQGGNPSVVNSLRVGKGNSRPLYDGDIVELCDYKLRVKVIGMVHPREPADITIRNDGTGFPPELIPPILLDADELTGGMPFVEPLPAEPAAVQPEPLEMTFDMDIDFEDGSATLGIDEPFAPTAAPAPSATNDGAPEIMLAAQELVGPMTTQDATLLSAFCLGLGVATPASMEGMLPQQMGIAMRRAMLLALSGMLSSFTPEELAKRLADRELLQLQPPADRKSKLWDLLEQRYADISHEAEDRFHGLLGSEFLKACEAQMKSPQEHN